MYLKRKIILTLIVTIMLACVIGFSYAKFMPIAVDGNNNINTIIGNTIDGLELIPTFTVIYDNGDNIINSEDMDPDIEKIIKFKVSTDYDQNQNIEIKMNVITNTTGSGTYILYSCNENNYNNISLSDVGNKCSSLGTGLLPKSGVIFKLHSSNNILIESNSTNYFVLYINTSSVIKNFYATISVKNYYTNSLLNSILAKYTPISDSTNSAYVNADTGINFARSSDLTNGQGLYINDKILDTVQGAIKYFRGGDVCSINIIESDVTSEDNCVGIYKGQNSTCYKTAKKQPCEAEGGDWITLDNYVSFGTYQTNDYYFKGYHYDNLNSCEAARGVGNCTKIFEVGDPIIWRILRINADNSIRIIHNMVSVRGNFNTTNDFTYTTSAGDSNAKIKIDDWYNTHLSSYSSYMINGEYCNDNSSVASSTVFANVGRVSSNAPIFSCPQNSALYGGKYILPVGIVSIDELMYAGLRHDPIFNFLFLDADVGTMSPYGRYSTDYNYAIWQYYNWNKGYAAYNNVTSSFAYNAVVTLKGDNLVTGKGTLEEPWVIQIQT